MTGIGALNLDEILFLPRMPKRDDSVPVERRVRRGGGSAANTVAWLSHLGRDTAFLGAVGDDEAGDILLEDLKAHGVDLGGVVRKRGTSGIAYCLVSGGDRRILVDPGVNDELDVSDLNLELVEASEVLHASSFIGLRTEKPMRTLLHAMEHASSEDVVVTFSPGTMVLRGAGYLLPYLEVTDVLFLNETEAEHLFGSVERAILRLSRVVETVVVTRGSKPAKVAHPEGVEEVPPEPLPEEDVVDPTGAGDAFAAGFIDAMLDGLDPASCCERGHEIAAECLKVEGCRPKEASPAEERHKRPENM